MITHNRRSPVVTCPHCEAPFKMTERIILEAVEHSLAEPESSRDRLNDRPVLYACPHCGKRSRRANLMGRDIEPFDARMEEAS